ncbi:MAG: long-chain fatty acid--CoA ligase [Pseudomonadota bacterium]
MSANGSSPHEAAVPGQGDANAPTPLYIQHYPQGIAWDQPFQPAPLNEMFDRAVAQNGPRPCVHFLGKITTYDEIGAMVDQAAAGLQAQGLGKGSKVGLLLPNCATYIVYYYATLKIGATVVNYNPLYTVEELTFQVKDSETTHMVTLDLKALFEKVEALLADGTLQTGIIANFQTLLPSVKKVLFRLFKGKELAQPAASSVASKLVMDKDLRANGGAFTPASIDPLNDLAVLQYTGGTTGTPKGAMLTHANLDINVKQVLTWAPILEPGQERMLGVLPFFHVFAMTGVMNVGLALGCELVLMPRFVLADAMKLITQTKPTIMPAVPTIFSAMLNDPKLKTYDLTSLKLCLSGGAPLPLEVKREFERVTSCSIIEAYGLSETSPGATITPLDGRAKEGSIGLPIPGTLVSLRDLENIEQEVPQGEKGEICIKGPQVMRGYWNRPQETANTFVGDYLRTGDVGIMDEEGFIFIVDRIKDLILCSGYNVYPRRIEEAIYQHSDVEEVTVIGIKDEYRGEAPKAFIKLKPGSSVDAAAIMAHLEPKLSKIELPSAIEFRDELPKTMIGKLSKKELVQEENDKA